jgi:uncharacterized protein
VIKGLLLEIWFLFREMSPYLLLGFTVAGILRVLIPNEVVLKYLSGKSWRSVVNASIIGVPLPLCSCGVIPVASHLNKMGVKKGPVLSFLTSTPTTGVDSILATYSLMGGFFAVIRVLASFTTGIISGVLSNLFASKEISFVDKTTPLKTCSKDLGDLKGTSLLYKSKVALKYAYIELIDDVSKWLIIGMVTGGLISYFVPVEFVTKYLGNSFISYSLMALIGTPMYVCSTGSIPIAVSLIMKGMNPGAGLVFLIVGPATSTATLSFVGGKYGSKTLFIYIGTIIVCAVGWGLILDHFWSSFGSTLYMSHHHMSSTIIKNVSAVILIALMLRKLK